MKKYFIILTIVLALIAAGAYAYTNPTATAPGGNTDEPIDIGCTYGVNNPCTGVQVKNGGLSVGTFQSRYSARFRQKLYLTGLVRGGHPADTNSTVQFGGVWGGANFATVVNVTKEVTVDGTIKVERLGGTGTSNVCAGMDGTFVRC